MSNNTVEITNEDSPYYVKPIIGKDLIDQSVQKIQSTSGKIRFLDLQGYSRSAIEKYLYHAGVRTQNGTPIRYQHIRNVLVTPITKK